MEWKGEEFITGLEQKLAVGLDQAASFIVGRIKADIGQSEASAKGHGIDPSKPGEEPKKLTGNVQRSITYEISEDGKEAYIGSPLPEAYYLEFGTRTMAARPFLRRSLFTNQDQILKFIIDASK